MNLLEKVQGIRYNWNELANKRGLISKDTQIGVLAQDVEAILPEAVTKGDDGILTVMYDRLIPLLIEAVKELRKEVNQLKEVK